MKSPDFTERFSLTKFLTVLLSLLLVVFVSSCNNNQPSQQTIELPSGQEITQTIAAQFESSEDVPADKITVSTANGVVTLSGTISNLLAKQKAGEIAEATFGVLSVVNNLQIALTRPDEEVDNDIAEALETDPATEHWEIASEVTTGVVTLTGRTDSWREKKLAETIASGVRGVTRVSNNIIAAYNEIREDENIQTEIERSLMMNSLVNANLVDVSVDSGNVTLSGAVGSSREKTLAGNLAYVTGVNSIDTGQLEVHPEYESSMFRNAELDDLTPGLIEETIMRALRYDPRVPADSITVTVEDDRAILAGSVENLNSKLSAVDDAQNTEGINTVVNNITVEHKVVVTPGIPTTNEAIRARTRTALIRDPYIDEVESIDITVDGGIVHLTGISDSQYNKDRIESIAQDVKGTIAIINDIRVGPSSES